MFSEFIESDVRKTREYLPVTEESVTNKWEALLPNDIINNSTILDLGCATGSAGYWCQSNRCKSYTGVELQDTYYQTSKRLLPKAEIIQADIETFLRTTDRQWEVVIAAGILHGVFNPFKIIDMLDKIATDYIIIESNETVERGVPTIHFRQTNMVKDDDMSKPYTGIATVIGSTALEFIMAEYGWIGQRVYPKKITAGIDPYHTKVSTHTALPEHVHRYAYIFHREDTLKKSLEHSIRK
jgi:hypothetical protein